MRGIDPEVDIDLRASATPAAFACPGSVRLPVLQIAERSEPADLGSAAHVALRSVAEGAGVPWDTLAALAAQWGVDPDELRMLAATGAKMWPHVADSFPNAITEVPLRAEVAPGVWLTGHADLLSSTATKVRLGDWKTGRKDADYSHQMKAYAALALLDDPILTEATSTVLWVRESEIENYTMTRPEALAWVEELRSTVIDWDGVFHPGSHCGYCKRSHECAAANALARRDVAAILDESASSALSAMEPDQIVALHQKASYVLKLAERVRDAIKAHVDATGDVLGVEGRLTIDIEKRRELAPLVAWPVLEAQGFEDEDFAACVDVKISRVEKRVAEKAGRGKGAAAVRAIDAALETAGAIGIREVRKLTIKRKVG